MERFQRNDTGNFACVQIEEQHMQVEIGRLNEEKLSNLSGSWGGMNWLQIEKHPEVSLAKQV